MILRILLAFLIGAMKDKILILSPGRQLYLIDLFRKHFDVFVGDNNVNTLRTYYDLPQIQMPRYSSSDYFDVLLDFVAQNKIKHIMSLSDIEIVLLAKNKKSLDSVNCHFIGLPYEQSLICLDKYLFAKEMVKCKIDTPKTYIDANILLSDLDAGEIDFPIIVKNRWGMGSRGVEVLKNRKELESSIIGIANKYEYDFLGEVDSPDKVLVFQEMMNGQEYGMDVVNDLNANLYCYSLKKKIEMRCGETDIASISSLGVAAVLAQRLSKCFCHNGNLDCDFILRNNTPFVIDVNPRFGGGYIFSLKSGLDVPSLLYCWANGKQPHSFIPQNIGKTYRKIIDLTEMK